MNYRIEMSSGAMIYIPRFINFGSGIQKLSGGTTHIQTHRQQGELIKLLLLFKYKESRLKTKTMPVTR
jgi:hypothetical protein